MYCLMNRYLAICHTLTLLEDPLELEAFRAAVIPANPLFQGGCSSPEKFLWLLCDEGLLKRQRKYFQLSALGQMLHQHLLNWTARDKAAIQQRKAVLQAQQALEPLQSACPACGSEFCARYLFVVLLERLLAGLESWNAWAPQEPELIVAALEQSYPKAQHIYLLNQTQTLQHLPAGQRKALKATLQTELSAQADPDLLRQFVTLSQQRLLLSGWPAWFGGQLNARLQLVSRLQLDYGLLPAERLQILQPLAQAGLLSRSEPQPDSPEQSVLVQVSRAARLGPQAILHLSCGSERELLWLEQAPEWQVQARWPYATASGPA